MRHLFMRHLNVFLLFGLFLLLFPASSKAQQWSTVLSSNRADANWPNAGAAIPTGTIPNCATQPSANTPAAISAAFTADAGGANYCKINIPAGTYNVSGTIELTYAGKANVILSGAGANQTLFVWTSTSLFGCNGLGATNLCVWNGNGSSNGGTTHWPNTASITAGLSQNSTTMTLSSYANLKVGSEFQIYQLDPPSDNGGAWFCRTTGFTGACSQQGVAPAPIIGTAGASESQLLTVTACGTSTFGAACTSGGITFTPAIKAPNWSLSDTPTAAWSNVMPIYNVGVENLSIDTSAISTNVMVMCHDCSNTWFTNMRLVNGTISGQAAIDHFLIWQSNHVTVTNSYMYGSNPQSGGYGVVLENGTSDSLAVNNISQHIATGYLGATSIGNVFAYNYAVDNYFGSGWQQCDEFTHDAGNYYDLFEGNIGTCASSDDIHGTSFANTWYRTYLSGFDPATECTSGSGSCPKTNNIEAYQALAYSRYNHVVGSVLGTSGKNTTYQKVGASGSASNCASAGSNAIFTLDYGNQNNRPFNTYASPTGCGDNNPPTNWYIDNDPLVASTMVRWGNWDVANGAVQENGSETASSAPVYPGLASPATTLPPSFYLATRPSWWAFPGGNSATPWPAIGPDVTGGNISGVDGHAYLNPAANCYLNVMKGSTAGSSGPLNFDPTGCYPASSGVAGGPPAPLNLSGTVVQ